MSVVVTRSPALSIIDRNPSRIPSGFGTFFAIASSSKSRIFPWRKTDRSWRRSFWDSRTLHFFSEFATAREASASALPWVSSNSWAGIFSKSAKAVRVKEPKAPIDAAATAAIHQLEYVPIPSPNSPRTETIRTGEIAAKTVSIRIRLRTV